MDRMFRLGPGRFGPHASDFSVFFYMAVLIFWKFAEAPSRLRPSIWKHVLIIIFASVFLTVTLALKSPSFYFVFFPKHQTLSHLRVRRPFFYGRFGKRSSSKSHSGSFETSVAADRKTIQTTPGQGTKTTGTEAEAGGCRLQSSLFDDLWHVGNSSGAMLLGVCT